MNTEQILAAIDEVRHDVDAWNHATDTRTYTCTAGPLTLSVRPFGTSWMYEVRHEQEGVVGTLSVNSAAEGRRLALDFATLYLQQVNA